MSSDKSEGWLFDWLDGLPAWGQLLVYPVIIPFMVAYGMTVISLFLAYIPFSMVYGIWEHRRFLKRLRQAGRVVSWAEIEDELATGRGTLILGESIREQLDTAWWIDEPVALLHAEHPLPTYRDWLAARSRGARDVFVGLEESVAWYEEQYLDAESGKASWTHVPRRAWPRLAMDFPATSVLVTLLSCGWRSKRRSCNDQS